MRGRRILPLLACLLVALPAMSASPSRGIAFYKAQNYPKAIAELQPLAEVGNAESQYHLAMSQRAQQRRERGGGYLTPVEDDPVQQHSHAWFEKAAKQGHAEAMAEFADDLDKGYGVPVDYALALEWMQKAHAAGSKRAGARLEYWYREGHIVKPDLAKADALLAERPAAQEMMGELTQYSAAMRQLQRTLAERTLSQDQQAAEAGDAGAALELAKLADSAQRAQRDCESAMKWYRRAGELGIAEGYYRLGVNLSRGSCGTQDMQQARDLFETASMTGHWSSLGELSRIELFGHTGAPDYPSAYLHGRLQEALKNIDDDPGPTAFARRHMSAEQIAAADAEVARMLPVLKAKMDRQAERETVRSVVLGGAATAPEWSYAITMADRSGACARNYLENCRYVPFQTVLDLTNRGDQTLACTLRLKVSLFRAAEPSIVARSYVMLPATAKKHGVGAIAGDVDAAQSTLDCRTVAQPSLADGTCTWQRPPGAPEYPRAALRSGQEGAVDVEAIVPEVSAKPSQVTVFESSGFPLLDEAAVKYLTNTRIDTNCPGAPMRVWLEFKLEH